MAVQLTCLLCGGVVRALKGQTLDAAKEIHEQSCPSPKGKKS